MTVSDIGQPTRAALQSSCTEKPIMRKIELLGEVPPAVVFCKLTALLLLMRRRDGKCCVGPAQNDRGSCHQLLV